MKLNKLRLIGNSLIVLAVMGSLWLIYPFIKEEWRYRFGQTQEVTNSYRLIIPAIKVQAPVIAGVDPFNQIEYRQALTQGIAQAKGTALPGEMGTQYLFAHSSDNPWQLTRYNTAFYRLPKLKMGDEIDINYQGQTYAYQVREIKTVKPWEVKYLTESQTNQLILQTCTPIGTDWNRLLVFADPV
ncbi:hypothetical protein A2W24_04300 [Microgenomates group bacterium RBG_16_45_19]|nr:MAG: hypothetical protein A2W24_04300 [Microgenomates group bacterium RBG_16_45_19]